MTDTTIFDMATGELTSDGYYFWQATARGFENTVAGSARDDIYGTDGPNVIRGGKSEDRLFGRGGNDRLYLAEGLSETVDGGPGTDYCNTHLTDEYVHVSSCEAVDH